MSLCWSMEKSLSFKSLGLSVRGCVDWRTIRFNFMEKVRQNLAAFFIDSYNLKAQAHEFAFLKDNVFVGFDDPGHTSKRDSFADEKHFQIVSIVKMKLRAGS